MINICIKVQKVFLAILNKRYFDIAIIFVSYPNFIKLFYFHSSQNEFNHLIIIRCYRFNIIIFVADSIVFIGIRRKKLCLKRL